MRVRNVQRHGGDKIELQMTPMIDIVFQLLIFFIFSFQFVTPEGDFSIKMPVRAPSEGLPDDTQLPPIPVRLRAAGDGHLASISMGEQKLCSVPADASIDDRKKLAAAGFAALHGQIRGIVGDAPGPGSVDATEVELDCSYDLKFEYVIDAISAVSGYVDQNGAIVKVVEKIRLSPPKK